MTESNSKTTKQRQYLGETELVDFNHPSIQALIKQRGWLTQDTYHQIEAVYNYVRDELLFGYNRDDAIPASEVLRDGYGQCNTKGTLLVALLRALKIPARIHGFTIDNNLQKGAIPQYLFWLAPQKILHTWVDVWFEQRWVNLEGYIVDTQYLTQIQRRFVKPLRNTLPRSRRTCDNAFSGFAIATPCLVAPQNQWLGDNTYIQREGIVDDFGTFDQPDDFYRHYGTNLIGLKRLAYRYVIRHLINRHVKHIRRHGL
ncbi:transglutaminase-like domain-containing protein [Thaumasiovibrio subtropicus]|uniref:transglutaminase-like domain-containing protein n=1 Tax=Thaumasiovibrio subtropicus TaxID=1891207 RepID=UPI000B35480D|nr:transglutaminase family protein [Thaumasiovibrio subtropicus]